MHQRQRRFHPRVAQIVEIFTQLGGQQHALINDGAGRQRHRIKFAGAHIPQRINAGRNHLAHNIKAALEVILILISLSHTNKILRVAGLGWLDALAKARGIDRDIAPAQKHLAFVGNGLFYNVFHNLAAIRVARQKDCANGILAFRRQRDTGARHLLAQKPIRNLNEHAAAVTGLGIRTHSTAVVKVQQNFETLGHNVMGLLIVHLRDKTDAAGIMFVAGVIKALGRRQAVGMKNRVHG